MSMIQIKVGPEPYRPFIIFQNENAKVIEVFYLGEIQKCIGTLAPTLIGVIRATRSGYPLPEMVIPFCHFAGANCLELTILPTPVGSQVEVELREYPVAKVMGWRDPKYSDYKLVHSTTMHPQEVADMLFAVLNKLVQDRLPDIYAKDRTTLKMALDAMEIYDYQARNLQWPKAAEQYLPPVAAAESDRKAQSNFQNRA